MNEGGETETKNETGSGECKTELEAEIWTENGEAETTSERGAVMPR